MNKPNDNGMVSTDELCAMPAGTRLWMDGNHELIKHTLADDGVTVYLRDVVTGEINAIGVARADCGEPLWEITNN